MWLGDVHYDPMGLSTHVDPSKTGASQSNACISESDTCCVHEYGLRTTDLGWFPGQALDKQT